MASQNRGVLAVVLSFLFLLSGPLSQFSTEIHPDVKLDFNTTKKTRLTDYNIVDIQSPNSLVVELSKSKLEVDESTIVQIHVRNEGMIGGDAEVLVEIVDLSGQRSKLAKTSVYVESQSVSTLLVDWRPDVPDLQRIEVTLGETTDKTEFVDVMPAKERGLLEDAIGATNPWILGTTITMLCIGVLFVLSWLRAATAKQGESDLDYEFDDDEFDDED